MRILPLGQDLSSPLLPCLVSLVFLKQVRLYVHVRVSVSVSVSATAPPEYARCSSPPRSVAVPGRGGGVVVALQRSGLGLALQLGLEIPRLMCVQVHLVEDSVCRLPLRLCATTPEVCYLTGPIHHGSLQAICDVQHDARSPPSDTLPPGLATLVLVLPFRFLWLGLLEPLPHRLDHLAEPVEIQTVQYHITGQICDRQPDGYSCCARPNEFQHLTLRRHTLFPT
jgi:hypothetical protein